MTGFGKASGTYSNKKITVEIKSLNSKNLDLFVRMPGMYKQKEIDLRKLIGGTLDRGKVECSMLVEQIGTDSNQSLNTNLLQSYYEQLSAFADKNDLSKDQILSTITRMPDVFSSTQEELDDEEWSFIISLVQKALEGLIDFRSKEGNQLQEEFELRISNIKNAFEQIPAFEQGRVDSIKARIENNLEEFVGISKVDKNRFEQELIYYLEKFDISEEKQRLSNHLTYFIETLNQPKSQGKKLGFISQEIGREINTLGSKSYQADMQKLVVGMKDELEKIKEQVLNTL